MVNIFTEFIVETRYGNGMFIAPLELNVIFYGIHGRNQVWEWNVNLPLGI